MRTKTLVSLIFLLIGISSYSQNTEIDSLKFIREEGTNSWHNYKDKNWEEYFQKVTSDHLWSLRKCEIDLMKIKQIAYESISAGNFKQLNNKLWVIKTIFTNHGEIVSITFCFKDESGFDTEEFANLSIRIKKEVKWDVKFDQVFSDIFYMGMSLPGPKLKKQN